MKEIDLDEILPICSDYSDNGKENGIYRIHLANVNNSYTGNNWYYEPFLKRHKTKEEAVKARENIFNAIKEIFK